MPKLNTTTSGIITATLTADSSPTLELQQNGVAIRTLGESQLVLGTSQSTATGATLYDFSGIPSWARRITVMFNGVSTTGTSNIIVQLGDFGGIEIAGYVGGHTAFAASVLASVSTTDGICVYSVSTAADAFSGVATICLMGSNTWAASGSSFSPAPRGTTFASSKTLSDTLDRIRITTQSGTPTFDAGSVNIMWE